MTNLKVQVVLGNGFIPVMDSLVTIKNEYITYSTPTAFDGSVYFTSLPTNKEDENGYLYDDYTLLVEKKDFTTVETTIRLYNEQDAICKIVLNRKDERLRYVASTQEIDNIMEQDMLHEDNLVAFAPPYIPPTITVHLGSPNTNAENLTLPFLDYIKNVACSEVYPSWPKEALYANIHAIVSLTLNRIYTGWYRIQGYSFDITSSTQYDQKFIKNRVIFDSISECVEDAFTTYIQKGNAIEPFFFFLL